MSRHRRLGRRWWGGRPVDPALSCEVVLRGGYGRSRSEAPLVGVVVIDPASAASGAVGRCAHVTVHATEPPGSICDDVRRAQPSGVLDAVADRPTAAMILAAMVAIAVLDCAGWAEQRRDGAETVAGEMVPAARDHFDLPRLMEVNRRQMMRYDEQVRGQGRASYWATLSAMIGGLIIVGIGLWISVTAGDTAVEWSAAAAGTAICGYIVKTFVALNSATQDRVRYHFAQPLIASYLIAAERLIAHMPEEDRPQQYRLLVEAAVDHAAAVPGATRTSVGRRAQVPSVKRWRVRRTAESHSGSSS